MLQFLQKLEDPARPLLGPHLKVLHYFGLLLPDKKLAKYLYMLLHLLFLTLAVTAWIEVWFVKSDMELLLYNVKITMLITVTLFKAGTFVLWQAHWKNIIAYVNRADAQQRDTTDNDKIALINKFTSYCRKLTYSYWCLSYMSFTSAVMQPVFKYLTSETYIENVRNGTESLQQIVSCWVPFDKNTIPGYLAASLYQTCASLHGVGVIISFDTTAMVMMIFFRLELELLRKESSEIFGSKHDPAEHDQIIRRLKECHRRHYELMTYFRCVDSCLSPINMLYLFVCSIMLCATTYQVTMETGAVKKLLMAVFLVFGVSQLFIFCWHSNDVLFASQDLMRGPYESRWWAHSPKYRKDLLMLTMQYNQPIALAAGPFATFNVATFINILKGTYSYYSLLTQIKE